MKHIIVKTLYGLQDALNSDEEFLQVDFINNRITKFPKLTINNNKKSMLVLRLYTPRLKTLKNVPVCASMMNWLFVEKADLTKVESASECNIEKHCICYLPCVGDKDIEVPKEVVDGLGFIRIVFAWQQFAKGYMQKIFCGENAQKAKACVPEMSTDIDSVKVPAMFADIMKSTNLLTTIEKGIAKKVLSMEVGELTWTSI